jgi:O-antigen/teichoic acid export membrane protein
MARLRRGLGALTLRVGMPVGFLIVAGSFAGLPLAIPLLFGESYAGMIQGAQWMVAATGVSTALFWLHPYYYSAGQVALWAKLFLMYGIGFVAAAWLISPASGFLGVALLAAASRIALTLGRVWVTTSNRFDPAR